MKTKSCPHCGSPIAEESSFCPYCAQNVGTRTDFLAPKHTPKRVLYSILLVILVALLAGAS